MAQRWRLDLRKIDSQWRCSGGSAWMTDGGGGQSWRPNFLSRESPEHLLPEHSEVSAIMAEWALAWLKVGESV